MICPECNSDISGMIDNWLAASEHPFPEGQTIIIQTTHGQVMPAVLRSGFWYHPGSTTRIHFDSAFIHAFLWQPMPERRKPSGRSA